MYPPSGLHVRSPRTSCTQPASLLRATNQVVLKPLSDANPPTVGTIVSMTDIPARSVCQEVVTPVTFKRK